MMVKNFFYSCLCHGGIPQLMHAINYGTCMPILAYHRVAPLSVHDQLLKDMIVDPEEFSWQMRYLKKHYTIISTKELVASLRRQRLPARTAVVTFDDGYEDNFVYAWPILCGLNLTATVFLSTDYIETERSFFWDEVAFLLQQSQKKQLTLNADGAQEYLALGDLENKRKVAHRVCALLKNLSREAREDVLSALAKELGVSRFSGASRLLSWMQIRQMRDADIDFGAHTHRHESAAAQSQSDFILDARQSKEEIEKDLGKVVELFAFPFGCKEDTPWAALAFLADIGFQGAVTMDQRLLNRRDHVYAMPRIGIGGNDTREIFKLKVSGVMSRLSQIKRLWISK